MAASQTSQTPNIPGAPTMGMLQSYLGTSTLPVNFNPGLQAILQNIHDLDENFLPSLNAAGDLGYRSVFFKDTIPQNAGTLAKAYIKHGYIDTDPNTAVIPDMNTSYNPQMNEVTIDAGAIEVTVKDYGRFYKMHRRMEEISRLDFRAQLKQQLTENAAITANWLAAIALYNGANKMFLTNYDSTQTKSLTLGADTTTVGTGANGAPLNWDALLECVSLFANSKIAYTYIDPTDASVKSSSRTAPIKPYSGNYYLAIVPWNGYMQLLEDPKLREVYVQYGGILQQQLLDRSVGQASPIMGIKILVVNQALTLSNDATPTIDTNGNEQFEVAFVMGTTDRAFVELSLEGQTQMISVGYDEDRKTDFYGMMSLEGYCMNIGFAVIQNETLYAIVYDKTYTNVASGNAIASTATFTA